MPEAAFSLEDEIDHILVDPNQMFNVSHKSANDEEKDTHYDTLVDYCQVLDVSPTNVNEEEKATNDDTFPESVCSLKLDKSPISAIYEDSKDTHDRN